jgi:hypothetical protein
VAFYEWWCPRCRVTHPPGRKVCVHCGGRVQASRDAAPAFDPRAALEARLGLPAPGGEAPESAEPADLPESRGARGARLGMTLVWIALAVVATVLRMCQERGG